MGETLTFPKPACRHGYTDKQLHEIFGTRDRYDNFMEWMYGQTMTICDGRLYNHELAQYEKGCDEAHGPVVYAHDLKRFLAGLPVID